MIYRKILCPIDFQQDPQPALTLAAKLARESRGTIYLMHVLPVPTAMLYPSETILHADWNWAHKKLQKLAAQLPAGTDREIIIKFGRTVEEIAKVARTVDADLIVMGTHGYTGLAHLIHGSVAERVVRTAPCQVLTVPLAKTSEESETTSQAA